MITIKNFMSTELSYSVVRCIWKSIENRLPKENTKKHVTNILCNVCNANSSSYAAYGPVTISQIFKMRDDYVAYVESQRKH